MGLGHNGIPTVRDHSGLELGVTFVNYASTMVGPSGMAGVRNKLEIET